MKNNNTEIQILTDNVPSPIFDHVVLAQCRVDDNHPIEILNPDEQVEWKSFDSDARRSEYLSTRWLITKITEYMAINPLQFKVQKDDFGKPYGVYKDREYNISIAHTNYHIFCGISAEWPLGVDIEPVDREIPRPLRTRIVHAKESKLLENVPTIQIWTIKEALVKLRGRGMRINLNECVITSMKNELFMAHFSNEKIAKIYSFMYGKNWLTIAWYP